HIIRGETDWSLLRQAAHRRHAEMYSDRTTAAGVAAIYDAVLADRDIVLHEAIPSACVNRSHEPRQLVR
ncbi:MAG TPA: hypothetical protein VKB78_08050, partial [Pirellulales bacterium]|nr:hypothetical protein [Pirellulales bacterium]